MKLEVLGTGCPKCNLLEGAVKAAADSLGLEYQLVHVRDISELMRRGVMLTPALAVDGEVVVTGRVPGDGELSRLLAQAANR